MYGFDVNPDELIAITDDDTAATITGGISPWMSTMRMAATMGADRFPDPTTLIHLPTPTPRW